MIKWIETTGRSEEDAISAALFQLGLDRDDVSVEVIERAKSGFLGFGSNPAKVRVSYEVEGEDGSPRPRMKDLLEEIPVQREESKQREEAPQPKEEPVPAAAPVQEEKEEQPAAPVEEETILAAKPGWKSQQPRRDRRNEGRRRPAPGQLQEGDEVLIGSRERKPLRTETPAVPVSEDDEKAKKIAAFLTGLMEHLDVQAAPEIFITEEGNYKVRLQGQDLGAIIGRRGETLDAIQQLTNYAINHGQSKRVRIHVDAEGYRSKREEALQRLAVKVAGKVVKYRKNMTLEPMNAYERHVIHTALQDYPNVTTYSTGVEPNRRTVVAYAPGQK